MSKNYQKPARFTLLVIGILTAFFVWMIATRLELDYDFENFFPQDDQETQYYREFRENFETDNDFVLIGVESEAGVFNHDFLKDVDSLTRALEKVENIVAVVSPTNIKLTLVSGSDNRPHEYNLLDWDKPEYYAQDSAAIYSDPRFVGTHFSTDGNSVAILAKTKQFLNKKECDQITTDLRKLVAGFDFKSTHLAGRAIGQSYYINLMMTDFIFFFSSSAVLLVVFLLIAFRSGWGVWVPLTVVMLSTLWTLGVMVTIGGKVNLVLTMLPTIMFVVGISDVVHIVTRYLEELRGGKSKIAALKQAYREVGIATFLTSLTTAIGFFTLLTASVGPIQDFGLYTGLGVFVAYILAFTLLPAVLILRKQPETKGVLQHHTIWYKVLHSSMMWVVRKPVLILSVAFLMIVGSAVCIWHMEVNNYLLEDLADDNPMKKDFVFFEEHFAGVRPFEMGVALKDTGNVFNYEVLAEIDRVEHYLQNEYGVGNIVSPLMAVKSIHMALQSGESAYFTLPDADKYPKIRKLMTGALEKDTANLTRAFISEDQRTARVQGKVADLGSKYFLAANERFEQFLKDSIPNSLVTYQITGTAHLVDKNNSYLASSLVLGLLIAFGVISLLSGIFFKSLRMIPIALIPNLLPLLLIAAIMYLTGQDLKVSTGIIFTIAFGIAVDDTIHFLSKFKLELVKGKSVMYAIKRTYLSGGRAIVITTLILCSGFLTLLFSQFNGTFMVGLLISVTLFFALIADLTLLPVMLMLFYKRKTKGTRH